MSADDPQAKDHDAWAGTTSGEGDHPPLEQAQKALEHLELVNVVPVRIQAESTGSDRVCTDVHFEVEMMVSVAPGFFSNRFRYQIQLLDEDEQPTAELDFVLQVEYSLDEDFELEDEAAEFLARTTGIFAAYPYARELAQTLSARLQQDPVVLGLMPRGATGPTRISVGSRRSS